MGAEIKPAAVAGDDAVTTANNDSVASQTNSDGKELKPEGREARYRKERGEARAEVERLTGVVSELQKQIIDGLVQGSEVSTRAFWLAQAEAGGVDALLTDTGAVDAKKVAGAVAAARDALGLGPRAPLPGVLQGRNGSGSGDSGEDWEAAFSTTQGGTP